MTPRLLEKYRKDIVPKLMAKFGYKNILEAPRLEKIVVNVGLGEAVQDKKLLDGVMEEMALITGQKPAYTRAKKSIAGFKIRKDLSIGCKITLRRSRMYEFLDRLLNVALPRIRDFRGVPNDSFDGNGNYSLGISEQGIFPEIEIDKMQIPHGMDIAIVMKAKNRNESFELLSLFGMPFKK